MNLASLSDDMEYREPTAADLTVSDLERAWAILTGEPVPKDRPDLRDQDEQRDHERYLRLRVVGGDITGSEPMRSVPLHRLWA